MRELKYVYGPVPSRRLGISLGISPIPKKTCNYSCIYCQLGRTDRMTNTRQDFFPLHDILSELEHVLGGDTYFDVITIVGEGEPTLYKGLGKLIEEVHRRTDKPIAVITNGALFYDPEIRREVALADIVSPTLDAFDEASFREINRPHGMLSYEKVIRGLKDFSAEYKGQLWLELMLVEGYNDDEDSLNKYAAVLQEIRYDRLYINTPVRPPAESRVRASDRAHVERAADLLGGVSIDLLVSDGFHSEIADDYRAILSIIKRHPMNQFEVEGFLKTRSNGDVQGLLKRLKEDPLVDVVEYKGYSTFRLK
ncbi:MAG TPA: radical SAM protein [Anaerovoracaceae bacterium]|nr:radical SAM protein [Eubacteriales bacterium]HRV33239.1 radical SAM protein [Anaerovoracaceae bacterium]